MEKFYTVMKASEQMPVSQCVDKNHYHNQNSIILFNAQARFLKMENLGEKRLLATLEKLEQETQR